MAAPSDPPAEAAASPVSPRLHNLQAQPTPLVGRTDAIDALCDRLRDLNLNLRLLTLTGPPGTGKTRLASAVAAELVDDVEHGVWFVRLETVRDPNGVVPAIAQTLGVRQAGTESLLETLTAYLAERQLLLVLDNFEQVLAAGGYVAELLGACPRLKVLVTSRAPLHLRWEHETPVAPLALPGRHRPYTVETVARSPAVMLFVQRAQAAVPAFRLSLENAADVAAICAELDGLPLAIELAAGLVKLMAPHQIRVRLRQQLRLLSGSTYDRPARHQSLHAALSWSYELLSPVQQALFRRLGVFVGGCTLEVAELLCGMDHEANPAPTQPQMDVLAGLAALVDHSLLKHTPAPVHAPEATTDHDEPRLSMLETVREFALEQLIGSGEEDAIRQRHAAYFLALAEAAEPKLSTSEQGIWLARLEAEHDNLRAALAWAVTQGEVETGLRLGGALWRFWRTRGHLSEGRRLLAPLLALPAAGYPALRAKLLNGAGNLAMFQGDYDAARTLHEEGLYLRREVGAAVDVAASLNNLGIVAQMRGEYAEARRFHEESLALKRQVDDRSGIAYSLTSLGNVVSNQGDYATAQALYEEGLAIRRELNDRWGIRISLTNLGDVAYFRGEYAQARELLEEAITIARALGDKDIGPALVNLGSVAVREGNGAAARAYLAQSITTFSDTGNLRGLGIALEAWAALAIVERRPERAARLFGAAEAIRDRIGMVLTAGDRALHDRDVAALRAALDDAAIAAAWAAGQAMSLDEAIAEALQAGDEAPTPPQREGRATVARAALPDGLTVREVEVLALIAGGATNREIADRLVVSVRTVEHHIAAIYRKINARGRADATAYALRHTLI